MADGERDALYEIMRQCSYLPLRSLHRQAIEDVVSARLAESEDSDD